MASRILSHDLESYEGDAALWAVQQSALIRAGRWRDADHDHIAEELAALGQGFWSAYVAALRLNMSHRLKFAYQPERATRSWRDTIVREIANAESALEDHPSFRSRQAEAMSTAYRRARNEAALDTGLPRSTFPEECPFSWNELMQSVPPID